MQYMKKKIYRSLALLVATVFSTGILIAQPGYHNDNNDRRYDNDRKGYSRNDDEGYRNYDRKFDDRNYAEYRVRHKPSRPVYVQPRRPSPGHVWIDGDWVYDRGSYRFVQGYWMQPRYGQAYVPGHWEKVRHGWYWVPGYWARGGRW